MRLNDYLNKSLNIIQIHINKDKDLSQHPEEVNIYLDSATPEDLVVADVPPPPFFSF